MKLGCPIDSLLRKCQLSRDFNLKPSDGWGDTSSQSRHFHCWKWHKTSHVTKWIWMRMFYSMWSIIGVSVWVETVLNIRRQKSSFEEFFLCKPIEMFYQSFNIEKKSKWNPMHIACILMHRRLTYFKMREQFIHFLSPLDCRFSPIIIFSMHPISLQSGSGRHFPYCSKSLLGLRGINVLHFLHHIPLFCIYRDQVYTQWELACLTAGGGKAG